MLIIIADDSLLCRQDIDLTLNIVLGNKFIRLQREKETKAPSLITSSTVLLDHVSLLCRLMA